ncbi:dGTP triphosphohydrolase [Chitinophaga jiangningensis]|nr:dNTP triphosphohydrolase [Chitinophaga jiangningensis]
MNWQKLLSTKRVSEFQKCSTSISQSQFTDPRSPYEKDCDQIIYSYPFRRLQDKTQVIPFPEYDFVHTRLTHSLEVASIGRSLGKLAFPLIIKELDASFRVDNPILAADIGALVAGACLAHDIGNPPFGHSGEAAISYHFTSDNSYFRPHPNIKDAIKEDDNNFYFNDYDYDNKITVEKPYDKKLMIQKNKIWKDFSVFEGNANGFRILTKNCEKGINPTAALLGTFSKYPREAFLIKKPYEKGKEPKSFTKHGFFFSERELFAEIANELGLLSVEGISDGDLAFHRHPLCYLMEAADDIAYGMIDFEDGCRLGLIDIDKHYKSFNFINKKGESELVTINNTPLEILSNIASIDNSFDSNKITYAENYKDTISYLRSKVINVLTHECFQIFKNNYEDIMHGGYMGSLIDDIPSSIKDNLKKMKYLIRKYVYNYRPVLESEASGFEVMDALIHSLAISSDICFSCGEQESEKAKKLSSLLPEEYRPKEEKELNSLTDLEKYDRVLSVLDYVSGMTDNYAMALYRKIKGISHR